MMSLGEMVAYLPIAGGHISLAARFADPALAFAMGWNYFYNWAIVLPAELSAAAVLIGYWSDVNPAAWIALCLVIVVLINFAGSQVYGECEFWFASIKVLTIVGLIILGIVIAAGGGPDHVATGVSFWQNPGPLVQYLGVPGHWGQFLGFWAVLIQSAFSYIGTEIIAIAAAEAKNPRRNLPRAVRRVYIRILLFYVVGVFIIGLLVPSNDKRLKLGSGTASASPFVIAINRAQINALPSIINACLLTSAWSAASSDVYTASRALFALAVNRNAPSFLKATNRFGLPWICVTIACLFGLLAFTSVSTSAGTTFGYFANMTSVCGLLTWVGILVTYLRWHKATKVQGLNRRTQLPFFAPLQPFAAWYGLVLISLVLFFNGFAVFVKNPDGTWASPKSATDSSWDAPTFITSYLPIFLFPILYFGYKVVMKTRVIPPAEVDLYTGIKEIEEAEVEAKPPRNFVERFWRVLM